MFRVLMTWYRRLPLSLRDRVRWLRNPVWSYVSHAARRAAGDRVASGPFRGMRLATASGWPPYLVGTQELELHGTIERLVAEPFDRVVNVGMADGYYAVGFALRMPRALVVGFEMVDDLRAKAQEAARANGVGDRLTVHGVCTPGSLSEALVGSRRPLVVIDVEGAEAELLDPVAVPALAHTTILVETHDLFRPGVSQLLRERFARTHRVETHSSRDRTLDDLPPDFLRWTRRAAPRASRTLMAEFRGASQEWLVLTPNEMAGGTGAG